MLFRGINKEILAISIPSIVTNITTPLLGLVDVAIAGHMGSAAYIGAIAIGGSLFNMLYWLFGFLRMGSSGMTAQAYGAGDAVQQSRVLHQALTVGAVAGLLMIACQALICVVGLDFMDVTGDTRDMAALYFRILIWGAPAVLCNYALCGWLVGMQNSAATMWISVVINVCNIGVSCLLVYVFHLGISGLATGTLVAQWCGLALGLGIAFIHYRVARLRVKEVLRWEALKRFFRVNTDIFLRTVCLVTVTMWFTRAGALQGDVMLAVNALLMQFFTIFSFFMDGFAFAGEALVGKYIGAGKRDELRSRIFALCKWGAGIAVIFTLLYAVGGGWLLAMLSDDGDVVMTASGYMWWVVTIPAVGFLAFSYDGIFIGATATRDMLLSMFAATIIFFVVYCVSFPRMGNDGLWLAFLCYLFTRGIILAFIGRRYTAL